MAISSWVPPPPPDPDTLKNPAPFAPFFLGQIRAGQIKKFGPFESAINKTPIAGPVTITETGIPTDEHAFPKHGGADKALLHYCTLHYDDWKKELPACEPLFKVGGFGENLFNAEVNEKNICIGDRLVIGSIVVEVSEPRAPCAKLNHRFEVRDMAKRAQTLLRTGWLYRIIKPGTIQTGDIICLLDRPFPEWTVARIMYYLFIETNNINIMKEIVQLEPLGFDIKDRFKARLAKGVIEDQNQRLYGDADKKMDLWSEYRILEKRRETNSVTAFVLLAIDDIPSPVPVQPGSHVRMKLGGKLVRAYSVVGGTSQRFEIGIALHPESRGGSKYLHEQAKVGDVLTVGRITSSFPLVEGAEEHIIIAAGIGITAFLTALKFLQEKGKMFHLHYAYAGEMPFRDHLQAVGSSATVYDKSIGKRMDVSDILSRVPAGAHVYTCGPQRLMDDVVTFAKKHNIPDSCVHLEQFVVTTSGDPFTAELKRSRKIVEIGPAQSLLDALKAVGMDVDSSCEVGNCGTCKIEVCEGRVEHRGTGLLDGDKGSSMLSCVSRGIGKVVLDL
jgi:MOSC domain-containing protein YiiM/ferredoxin-NADP reductase